MRLVLWAHFIVVSRERLRNKFRLEFGSDRMGELMKNYQARMHPVVMPTSITLERVFDDGLL
jgi:hypothetical protein